MTVSETTILYKLLGQFSNWCRGALKGHGRGTLWVAVPKMQGFSRALQLAEKL
jgi:hypothetical protein